MEFANNQHKQLEELEYKYKANQMEIIISKSIQSKVSI